jgi:hypothetical protein
LTKTLEINDITIEKILTACEHAQQDKQVLAKREL